MDNHFALLEQGDLAGLAVLARLHSADPAVMPE
jgi:hypothetical protein